MRSFTLATCQHGIRSEADNAIAYEIIDRAEEPEPVVARAG